MREATLVLPDLLSADLDILFCGTAAGSASAARQAYYAGPGNAFWPTLYAVGLIPHPLEARDYRRLLSWKMGLTDLAKHVSGSDANLARTHFDAPRVRRIITLHRPRIVAFTSKRAAAEFVGRDLGYGLAKDGIAACRLFVLPSPSGAARRHWDAAHWRDLAVLRSTTCGAPRV